MRIREDDAEARPVPGQPEAAWVREIPEMDRLILARAMGAREAALVSRPALVVIDVLYGFTGSRPLPILDAIAEFPTSCGEAAWRALPRIAAMIEGFRAAALPVVWIKGDVSKAARLGHATKRSTEGTMPNGFDPGAIHPDVAPDEDDAVIVKSRASAFFATVLPVYLNRARADGVVVVGSTTSGCVRASVVDSYSLGYETFVVADCCFDRSPLSHAVSLFDMGSKYASVVDADEMLRQIRSER
jgi:maleamate amidohydrolase